MKCHALVVATLLVTGSVAFAPAEGGAARPPAPSVTISPVVQTVAGKPGRYQRKFELRYTGPKRARVSIKVEELDLISGRILRAPENTARRWVTLDRDGLTLKRGVRRTVRAVVRVPQSHGQRRRRIGVVFTITSAAGGKVRLTTRLISSIHVFARPR